MMKKKSGVSVLGLYLAIPIVVSAIVGARIYSNSESFLTTAMYVVPAFFITYGLMQLISFGVFVVTRGWSALSELDLPDEKEAERIRKSGAEMLRERRRNRDN